MKRPPTIELTYTLYNLNVAVPTQGAEHDTSDSSASMVRRLGQTCGMVGPALPAANCISRVSLEGSARLACDQGAKREQGC